MRESSYDNRVVERVQQLTGLTGNSLDYAVGAAIMTATIGKYPTKVDLYTYLGVSERDMDHISHQASKEAWDGTAYQSWLDEADAVFDHKAKNMVYTLATDLVANNYLDDRADGNGKVRLFLDSIIPAQKIYSRALFSGYLITLEYLRHRERGLESTLTQFIRLRYGRLRGVYDDLVVFCQAVAENDSAGSFLKDDYGYVIGRMRELLKISD